MRLKIARKAGFCMGVRRAVNLVLRAVAEKRHPIYTYGPLIHNPQTLKLLDSLGVKIIKNPEEDVPPGVCIVRAHGVSPEEKKALAKKHEVIDGTCPRVLRVQALAKKAASQGKKVIIIGDKNHAEVKGILGYAGNKGFVVSKMEDIEDLPELNSYIVLSQTTQDQEKFKKLSEEILKRFPNGKVINTICNATELRQNEVRRLASICDAIVVIGGKFSANTNRLAEIARHQGKEVYLIESPEELDLSKLRNKSRIGITAGASTPNWLINEVVDYIKMKASIPYRILKAFSFLGFLQVFNFFLLFLGLLSFLGIPFLKSKYAWLSGFVFFFLLFRYSLTHYLQKDVLPYFYSVKAKSINRHSILIKVIIAISLVLSVFFAIKFNPRLMGVLIGLIFLDQILKESPLWFLWEVIFLGAISLYLYNFWTNPIFSFVFLQTVLMCVFVRFYLEVVYFQTDGFLPPSFIVCAFSYDEKKLYKIMQFLILAGILTQIPLWFISVKYAWLILPWIVGYIMILGLKARPLGQIIYLESLSVVLPLVFFLSSFGVIFK